MGYRYYAFGVATTEAGSRKEEQLTKNLKSVRNIIGKDAWLHLLGVTAIDFLVKWKGLYDSFDSTTCTKSANNAILLLEDGGRVKLTPDDPLYPRKMKDYLRLQLLNYENYVKQLEEKLWKN